MLCRILLSPSVLFDSQFPSLPKPVRGTKNSGESLGDLPCRLRHGEPVVPNRRSEDFPTRTVGGAWVEAFKPDRTLGRSGVGFPTVSPRGRFPMTHGSSMGHEALQRPTATQPAHSPVQGHYIKSLQYFPQVVPGHVRTEEANLSLILFRIMYCHPGRSLAQFIASTVPPSK